MNSKKKSKSLKLDSNSLQVLLLAVEDHSEASKSRSQDILNSVAKILVLSSKRGRVKKDCNEVFDEAA